MLVVVGGHTRNVGKTSVVAGLIRSLPEMEWTAAKITQSGHHVVGSERLYLISEERDPALRNDSARLLAAGARRAFWVRTAAGQLARAMPEVQRILDESANAIFESNSILQFLRPDLYLVVADLSAGDIKESSRRFLDRADAFVLIDRPGVHDEWRRIPSRCFEGKPQFKVQPPDYSAADLTEFVRRRAGR